MTTAFLGVGGGPSGGELLLLFLAALLLFGSKRLPEVARTIGRAVESMRRAAAEVRSELLAAQDDTDEPLSTERKTHEASERDEHGTRS